MGFSAGLPAIVLAAAILAATQEMATAQAISQQDIIGPWAAAIMHHASQEQQRRQGRPQDCGRPPSASHSHAYPREFLTFGGTDENGAWPGDCQTNLMVHIYGLDGQLTRQMLEALSPVVNINIPTACGDSRYNASGDGVLMGTNYASCIIHTVPATPNNTVVDVAFWRLGAPGSIDSIPDRQSLALRSFADDRQGADPRIALTVYELATVVEVFERRLAPFESEVLVDAAHVGAAGEGRHSADHAPLPEPPSAPTVAQVTETSDWFAEVRDVAEGLYLPCAHARTTDFRDALLAIDAADGSDTLKGAPESGTELVVLAGREPARLHAVRAKVVGGFVSETTRAYDVMTLPRSADADSPLVLGDRVPSYCLRGA